MNRIYLNEWIEAIRLDLQQGIKRAAARNENSDPLRLALQEVTIEVSVQTGRDVEGHGGIKFWVVEAGAQASHSMAEIQKLTITLAAAGDTHLGDESGGDLLPAR
jgi:hypothetical protein